MDTNINCIGCNKKVEIQNTNCPFCDTEIKLSIKHFVKLDQVSSVQHESSQLAVASEDNDKTLEMLRERLIEIEGEETRKINEAQNTSESVAEPNQADKEKLPLREKLLFIMSFTLIAFGMVASLAKPLTGIIIIVGALLLTPKIQRRLMIKYEWLGRTNLFVISHVLIIAGLVSTNDYLEAVEQAEKLGKVENIQ